LLVCYQEVAVTWRVKRVHEHVGEMSFKQNTKTSNRIIALYEFCKIKAKNY